MASTIELSSLHTTPHSITATMFRTALLRSARCVAQTSARAATRPAVRTAIRSPFITSRVSSPATTISAVRCYASSSGIGQEEVTGRILDLLKNFDKVRRMIEAGVEERHWLTADTGAGRIKGTSMRKEVTRIWLTISSSRRLPTSRTTSALTAWIPWRWSWR